MKHTALIFVALLGAVAVAQAQFESDDEPTIVITTTIDDDMPSSVFQPFSLLSGLGMNSERPDLTRVLSNFFSPLDIEDHEEEPSVDIVQVFDSDSDMFDQSANEFFEEGPRMFSRVFERMHSLLNSFSQRGMNQLGMMESSVKPMKRGGCTLLQACGSDIDAVCGYAKRSNLAQAIPRCLQQHREQVSEECGAYIDRFFGDDSSESTENSDESESTESTPTAEVPSEPVPSEESSETSSSVSPRPSSSPCRAAAALLCSEVDPKDRVGVMACLSAHQNELPSDCLEKIKDTAAFNCAQDAKKFCPEVVGRRAIGRCLKPHFNELSDSCKTVLKALAPSPAPAPSTENKKIELDSVRTQYRTSTPVAVSLKNNDSTAIYIGLGVGGFVTLVVVAIVVIRRRRRQVRRVATVQLVNPSRGAVAEPQDISTALLPSGNEQL